MIDLVLADELSDSRTFFIQGINFDVSGSFSRAEVGPLETSLVVFRASTSPSCPAVEPAAASAGSLPQPSGARAPAHRSSRMDSALPG